MPGPLEKLRPEEVVAFLNTYHSRNQSTLPTLAPSGYRIED